MKTQVPVYKSIFKGLKESKEKQLKKIVESLKTIKKQLREEDDELGVGEESPEVTASAIGDIVDKVEDLVVDAINSLGATDEVTSELIATAGSLETMQDEEEMIAAIDASASEADEIQEEFEPVYDSNGNVVNDSYDDEFIDEPFVDDSEFMMDDEFEVYENIQRKHTLKKFKK